MFVSIFFLPYRTRPIIVLINKFRNRAPRNVAISNSQPVYERRRNKNNNKNFVFRIAGTPPKLICFYFRCGGIHFFSRQDERRRKKNQFSRNYVRDDSCSSSVANIITSAPTYIEVLSWKYCRVERIREITIVRAKQTGGKENAAKQQQQQQQQVPPIVAINALVRQMGRRITVTNITIPLENLEFVQVRRSVSDTDPPTD